MKDINSHILNKSLNPILLRILGIYCISIIRVICRTKYIIYTIYITNRLTLYITY